MHEIVLLEARGDSIVRFLCVCVLSCRDTAPCLTCFDMIANPSQRPLIGKGILSEFYFFREHHRYFRSSKVNLQLHQTHLTEKCLRAFMVKLLMTGMTVIFPPLVPCCWQYALLMATSLLHSLAISPLCFLQMFSSWCMFIIID